jgi:hypothetical protein
MTSTDMITSLASMNSTASLASKNQNQYALNILGDFPGIWNLSGLNDLNSLYNLLASGTSVGTMISAASFHQKNY